MNTFTQTLPDELSFDLTRRELKLTIGGEKFVATEASEAAVIMYRNAGISGVQLNEDGNPSKITEIGSSDSVLLSRCLYFADKDGNLPMLGGEPNQASLVPVERIRKLPSRVTKPIIEWVKEASELDQDDPVKLEKEITKLQKKLDKMRANAPKGEPITTPNTSG